MKIDDTTDAFWVLYLINVLQPISRDELEAQTRHLMEAVRHKSNIDFNFASSLSALVAANMVVSNSDGSYAVTILGLQRLSMFNLGFVRDKNRIFVLKNKFRR